MTLALSSIAGRFEQEVDQIQSWFLAGSTATVVSYSPFPYSPLADGCVVSLWDAWGRFVREVMLGCAMGPVLSASGATYSPTIARTEPQALAHLVAEKQAGRSYRLAFNTKGEPKWYMVADAYEIADALGLANRSVLGGALATSSVTLTPAITIPHPAFDLQVLRNYVAHKSAANLKKVAARVPIHAHADVHAFLSARTGGGSNTFCDWADGLVAIAAGAVR